jgi:hypothetical protein
MKRTSKTIGLTLAASAAALFATGCSTLCGGADDAPVKCTGVNACKGTSACATPDSSCKGQNSCRGNGWVHMSKDECLRRGGEVVY